MKKNEEESTYPFGWLDELAEKTLNPEYALPCAPESPVLKKIEQQLDMELTAIYLGLKKRAFFLLQPDEITLMVEKYLQALTLVNSQALQDLAALPEGSAIHQICENLIVRVEETQSLIRRRYSSYLRETSTGSQREKPESAATGFKVLCQLSVDQLAIILKAADDSKLLLSRSLSLVFRSIVPYLSTEKTKNISWNSMRKSTYQPEKTDQDTAIQALEKLIRKIREY